MSKKKFFDGTIPVTKTIQLAGNVVMHQLNTLQTEYLANNFNTTIGTVLKNDVTIKVGNAEEQFTQYPAYNLCQFGQALQRNFFQYALHHASFKDVPVLAQYEFPEGTDKYVNVFVLGGDDKSMYIIYEDYQNDTVYMLLATSLPHVGKIGMKKVTNSTVRKVSDIWNYHYNAFMAFEAF